MRRVQSHATRPMLNCSSNFCLGITSSCRSAKPLGCWGCVRCIDAIVSKGVARTLNPYCPICVRTFCTTPRTPPHVHPTPPRLPHLPPHTRPHFTPPHTSAHPPAAGERAHTYLDPPHVPFWSPGAPEWYSLFQFSPLGFKVDLLHPLFLCSPCTNMAKERGTAQRNR